MKELSSQVHSSPQASLSLFKDFLKGDLHPVESVLSLKSIPLFFYPLERVVWARGGDGCQQKETRKWIKQGYSELDTLIVTLSFSVTPSVKNMHIVSEKKFPFQ